MRVCVCVCVFVFIKVHITAQSGLAILVILYHSHGSSQGGIKILVTCIEFQKGHFGHAEAFCCSSL